MAHRPYLNTLTPAQRMQLANLLPSYLTDPVVADHTSIIHSGLELFTGHRAYILGMENYLSANGGGAFVPLPFWNSANPIPPEFKVVKNPGPLRPPLVNLNPNIPKPVQCEYPAVCEYDDAAQLGNDINGWHGSVHVANGHRLEAGRTYSLSCFVRERKENSHVELSLLGSWTRTA